ncbi:unnamed protein product [Ceutorhynchus assimilis]|uniref:Protein charybde n=1 Tax=Ceutorhynchus assimilis TaxID=467358 RepID=A0A9P0GWW3_9CUCU|nr:unnamed protein product [Ceutorhynchus assimilis]
MFRSGLRHEVKDSKLQGVFSKLSQVLPRAEDFPGKIMSSDIIESVLADTPVPANPWPTNYYPSYRQQTSPDNEDIIRNVATLSRRLEQELRAAKRSHLACGEVLLPCGLLLRVACDISSMAESEPCGLRGCHLYVLFEPLGDLPSTRIAKIQCDPGTACTFELYLTFKQSGNGWNFLPQFLRNFTKGGSVVLSPAYTLSKKKLYRSYADQQQDK